MSGLIRGISPITLAWVFASLVDCATASIVVTESRLLAYAERPSSNATWFNGTSLPTNQPLNAATGINSYSSNQIAWTQSNGQTTFRIDMDHGRDSGSPFFGSYAGINYRFDTLNDYFIRFDVVGDPVNYSIAGIYSITSTGSVGLAQQYARLTSTTDNTIYFLSNQEAPNDTKSEFELGTGAFQGSPNGVLQPGSYQWSFSGNIQGGSPATAEGFFELALTGPNDTGVVPEATSFLTWGLLGLTGAVIASSRRKRRG